MGGAVKSWVKDLGDTLEGTVNTVGNLGEGILQADLDKVAGATTGLATDILGAGTGATSVIEGVKLGGAAIADVTGVTAMQERLQQEAELSAAEARRRALISDAMARNQGGEDAKITLNSQRNRRKGNVSATGIAGMDTSVKTGVQG